MDINKNFKLRNFNLIGSDEIDLKDFLKFIIRNKLLIGAISFISFISFYLFSLTIKKTWKGEFQIVVNSENNSSISTSLDPGISQFLMGRQSNDLDTEVGILQSPSLLMPIFEFVESKKKKDFSTYKDWQENLDIQLKANTSILTISYIDQEKDLILPVLDKLSSSYQEYSGRKERRDNALTKKYLTDSIEVYKEKGFNSLRKAQQFAIDENLNFYDNFLISPESTSSLGTDQSVFNDNRNSSPLGSNIKIEETRVESLNRIKQIDLQLKKIYEMGENVENLQRIVATIPSLDTDIVKLNSDLNLIDQQILMAELKYTQNDIFLKNLFNKKNTLIKLLKTKVVGFLNAEKIEAETLMEAVTRPKEVLLKYKNLMTEAARDESTLMLLEKQKRFLELQEAKISDPWELITNPTLLADPVAPRKRNIALSGLAIGLFFGILFAKIKEKNSGKIFDIKTFENIFSAPIIEKINIDEQVDKEKVCIYLREYIKNNFDKKICLSAISEIDKKYLNKLKDIIINTQELKKLDNFDLILDNYKIDNFLKSNRRLLLVSLKNLDYEKIKEFKRNLLIFDIKISGLILLTAS